MPTIPDPWQLVAELRALPLVAATAGDEPINGGDAVEALCDIRARLDAALRARAAADQEAADLDALLADLFANPLDPD